MAETWLYAIQEKGDVDGPVKVGFAKDPWHRIHDFQTGNRRGLVLIDAVPRQGCRTRPA